MAKGVGVELSAAQQFLTLCFTYRGRGMSVQNDSTEPMIRFYEAIFDRALERALERRNAHIAAVDEVTATKIAKINAKPRITVQEAALYLNCSESHLYTKIKEAKKGTANHPIPFLDLDGVYVLPREELLAWAQTCKEKKGPKGLKSRGGRE
jgi:hypothetical protein